MTSVSRTHGLLASLLLACAVGVAGCGGEEAAARVPDGPMASEAALATDRDTPESAEASSRTATTLGTIRANVDGEPRTWYVVAGEAADGPYASGTWLEWSEDSYMLSLGGLDSEDPPIGTFHRGGEAGAMSMGDYDGGGLTLTAQLDPSDAPATFTVPEDALAGAVFAPVLDMADMTNALVMVSGTVEVAEVEISGTTLRARGTFSGTFEPMGGGGAVVFTDGSFDVRDLPHADRIQPREGP